MLKKLVLAAAGALACSSAFAQETSIRFSNWLPPTHPITTDILEPWAEDVKEATDGRVTINFISAVGKPPAHFDLVRDGVADAAMSVHAYTADRFPSAYGMTFPGYANDATSASVAYWRTHEEHFAKLNEFEGVHLVGLWTHGPGHIFTRDEKVTSIDDLEGLRLRATGGIVQDISERLGIVPQFASASEAYELLSRGVVDGVMFNSDSVYSFNMQDLLDTAYRIDGGLYRDTHYVIMNQAAYDGMSEDDRAAFDSVSGEALARLAGEAWDKVETAAWTKMEKQGYTITEADQAALDAIAAAGQELEAEWIARMEEHGVDGEAALETFRGHIAEISDETAD